MEYDPRLYEQIAVSDNDTHNIVLSYLIHNCFKETVESFICSTGIKKPADCLEDIDRRKRPLYTLKKSVDIGKEKVACTGIDACCFSRSCCRRDYDHKSGAKARCVADFLESEPQGRKG